MTNTIQTNAILAWEWLSVSSNSESSDDETGDNGRRFSPHALHRQAFAKSTKADVDDALNLLHELNIVGDSFSQSSGGRPKEFRSLNTSWIAEKSDTERLKAKLIKLLGYHCQSPDVMPSPAMLPTEELDSKNDMALKCFAWLTDLENQEIDNRNQPFFSVERLRRALGIDQTELNESLRLLTVNFGRADVLGMPTKDSRGRSIHYIQAAWLKSGSLSHLKRILQPEPPKLQVPHGPARVLRDISVYVGKLFMTFKTNDIVREEFQITALLTAGAILAKLDDTTARVCENSKCRHRFDISEAPELDFPIFEAIKRDLIRLSGSFFHLSVNIGDVVFDRLHCLTLARMKERVTTSFREIPADNYTCCPKCKSVSKKNPELAIKK
jgi:hypothetical protein